MAGVTRAGRSAARRLDGRVALVAGADGETGRAIALGFAREGAKVALMSAPRDSGPDASARHRHEPDPAVERARARIEALGTPVMTIDGNPEGTECAFDAVRRTVETWGAIDALVLDSTERRGSDAAAIVRAARPYLGKGALLANVVRSTGPANAPAGPTLVEHASIRAARTGFLRSVLAELAREGVLADGAGGAGRRSAFARLRPGTGALRGLGRHVLSLRDGRPEAVAACVLHLARADADWSGARD